MFFARDWAVVLSAVALLMTVVAMARGSTDATLLAISAAACWLSAAWLWAAAAYFRRRERRGVALATGPRESKQLLGEWMFSLTVFPLAPSVSLVEGTPADLVPTAAMAGFILAAVRVVARAHAPDTITMADEDRTQLIRLLKLTAAVAVVGYLAVIFVAIAGGDTWAPIWPGLALGLLCGVLSLAQLAQATARQSA